MIYGIRKPRNSDTLDKVLNAPDVSEIADWLRSKPLLVVNEKRKFIMSHAGIYPWWGLKQTIKNAHFVEKQFQSETKCIDLLKKIYSNNPTFKFFRKWL